MPILDQICSDYVGRQLRGVSKSYGSGTAASIPCMWQTTVDQLLTNMSVFAGSNLIYFTIILMDDKIVIQNNKTLNVKKQLRTYGPNITTTFNSNMAF